MAANPTPTPGEYKRDVGSGEPLPSGGATQANEALVQGDATEQLLADATAFVTPDEAASQGDIAPPPVQYATAEEPDYTPANGIEKILFGDPEGLNLPTPDRRPLPQSVVRALPLLATIAADPSTPASVKAAYRLIVQRMEAEQEARY